MQPRITCIHLIAKVIHAHCMNDYKELSVVKVLPIGPKEAPGVFCSKLGNHGLHKSNQLNLRCGDDQAVQQAQTQLPSRKQPWAQRRASP